MQNSLTSLKRALVEHTAYTDIFKQLCETINEVGAGSPPLGCYSILGPPNVGKSTLIEMIAAGYPRVIGGCKGATDGCPAWTADHLPVLCLKMPSSPRVTTVLRALLRVIGDPKPNTGSEDELRSRLDNYIRRCSIQAIIFDDAQRAVDRLGRITQDNLAELLKDLFDDHGLAVVLVGLPRTRHLFVGDAQFDRRFLSEVEFKPYTWGDPKVPLEKEPSRLAFMGLVDGLAENSPVPFDSSVDVRSEEVAQRLFYASLGLVGRLKMLLLLAVKQAGNASVPAMDMGTLEAAYEKAFRTGGPLSAMENPFSEDWDPKLPPPLPGDANPVVRRTPGDRAPRKSQRRAAAQAALSPS